MKAIFSSKEFETNLDAKTVSTMEETDKKCPSCFGVMDFDPETGGLTCPYCGHKEAILTQKQENQSAQEISLESADKLENFDWGMETKTVICKACGAESIYDALELAAVCPFCGSNQVMEAADKDTMAPGGVVPFAVTDKKASELFRAWIKKKWFCPKLAKESAQAKHFKGIYLPYWTFDANTSSTYKGEFGRDKVKRGFNGQEQVNTKWYSVKGSYEEAFDDELICASANHNLSMLQSLEPYRTAENKTYKPEYIAGFVAEKYGLGVRNAWELTRDSIRFKIKQNIEDEIRHEHRADRVKDLKVDTLFSDVTYKYLLLPVWISSYKYHNRIYQFMVNGQTGKVAGRIPISKPKVIISLIAVFLIAALFMWMCRYL